MQVAGVGFRWGGRGVAGDLSGVRRQVRIAGDPAATCDPPCAEYIDTKGSTALLSLFEQ